jgi:hypothetical protein
VSTGDEKFIPPGVGLCDGKSGKSSRDHEVSTEDEKFIPPGVGLCDEKSGKSSRDIENPY